MLRKFFSVFAMAALALAAVAAAPRQSTQQAQKEGPPDLTLKVGDSAPDFTLRDQAGKEVSLHDFRGSKSVVLAFYIFAFTGG